MGPLSKRALIGLKAYQYKSGGYTPLELWHQPFWNYIVTLLPRWMAPNLITLIGLSAVIMSYFLMAFYQPNFDGEAPRWAYLFSGFAVCFYVHMDCIDGKQARRTQSASPLGQLFDHGCDALSIYLLLATVHCSFGQPCSPLTSSVTKVVMWTWMLAHWEEYHTGIIMYGDGYIGVLEANYALALAHLLAFFVGPGFWSIQLNHLLPFDVGFPFYTRYLFFPVVIVCSCIQAVQQVARVFRVPPADMPLSERGHKQLGTGWRIVHAVLLTSIVFGGFAWTSDRTAVYGLSRAADSTFGLLYALFATQLIMAHMAKEPVELSPWALACLVVGVANRFLRFAPAMPLVLVLHAIVLAGYLQYIVRVINQICEFLGIRCLSIKPWAA